MPTTTYHGSRRTLTALALCASLALLAGCGPADGADPGTSHASGTSPPADTADEESLTRCANAPDDLAVFALEADGGILPAATLGEGNAAAVLLHQTNGDGGCGWFEAAGHMTAAGIQTVMLDLCGYGRSECGEDAPDELTQVRAAVDHARAAGASRITVIGASTGGSIAIAVGEEAGADAIIDLSGPSTWDDLPPLSDAALRTTVPTLVAGAEGDVSADAAALEHATSTIPGTHRYIAADSGHGYTLLIDPDGPTDVMTEVIAWTQGDFSAADA